jgi:hypothetical protein
VIVSVWFAEVNPLEATVMIGLPAVVSLKKKLPVPPVIPTDVTVPLNGPPALVSNRIVPDDEDKFAVPVYPVTKLLNASWAWNVTTEEATPAVTVCGALVMVTLVAVPAVAEAVKVWGDPASPVTVAV